MTAEVTRHGVFDMQVCVPAEWTNEQARIFAEQRCPCGTTGGWQVREYEPSDRADHQTRVPCSDRAGHVHIMLDA